MKYPEIYDGPPRHFGTKITDKNYIAIHCTANDASAEAEANYAQTREDYVSSHYYIDNNSIVQSLDTAFRAYHAGSTVGNDRCIAYEFTGTNARSPQWWMDNIEWSLVARQIALDCKFHGIVPRPLTITQMQSLTLSGIVTHNQMRLAWGHTTHTDPGPNFPLNYLIARVAEAMEDDMTPQEMLDAVVYTAAPDNSASVPPGPRSLKGILAALDARSAILHYQRYAALLTEVKVQYPDVINMTEEQVLFLAQKIVELAPSYVPLEGTFTASPITPVGE